MAFGRQFKRRHYLDENIGRITRIRPIFTSTSAGQSQSDNAMSLAAFKAQTAGARQAAQTAAERLYTATVGSSDAIYAQDLAADNVTWFADQNAADAECLAGEMDSYAAYLTALEIAQKTYEDEQCRLAGLLQDSVDTGYNMVADGTSSMDFQVCFRAGTKVWFLDSSHKTVEKMQLGDIVKMVDQHDPTGKIVGGKVVRIFHNDPQPLWILKFGEMELGVTKEHPFYVKGKGWVPAGELEIGDICRTATDGEIILTEKEFDETPVPVYNFEVEGGHTYFVGDSEEKSVLVHNTCPDCGGSGMITTCVPITRRYLLVRSYVEQYVSSKACPRCQFEIGERKYRIRSTPDVKPVTIRADNTMEITIDRPEKEGRIYILFGHGLLTPHSINFKKDKYLAATFVMCHAGISNRKIPKEHQLPQFCTTHGTLMQGGNINDPDTTSYWKDIAFKGGIQIAEQWLIENPQLTHVVIYTKNLENYRKIQLEDMAFEAEASQIIKRQ